MCPKCLRNTEIDVLKDRIVSIHAKTRKQFNLPLTIPKSDEGITCTICSTNCSLQEGEWGWCAMRQNKDGKFDSLSSPKEGLLSYYLDPQVTNCCNAWFCPAGTGCGYPTYANKETAEFGYQNLSLFLFGCSFNCLFCQNWSHKFLERGQVVSTDHLIEKTLKNDKISCWCWFGGSPEPQLPFTLYSSKKMLELTPENRVMRICLEWNGCGNPKLVERIGEVVYKSGGNIKFDFKAWTPSLHYALTGRSNQEVKKNIRLIYDKFERNNDREVQMLGISSLLVPYYVDANEVEQIAKFLAEIDPQIHYSLLVFHPDFVMRDLPITPKEQVMKAYEITKKYLENVHIGNKHLLR
jgi:pyruvate formate lyase activating enzyme